MWLWLAAVVALFAVLLSAYVTARKIMPRKASGKGGLRVAFVHPDLGIGGAERLIVDSAVGLKSLGHSVIIYAFHHNPAHAFAETRDGTLPVKVYGSFIPHNIKGRFQILFVTIRALYLATIMLLFEPRYDVIVVDQITTHIAVLKLTGSKILYYCHFPDLMLAGSRGFFKSIYRIPFDWFEEKTTFMADTILANSKFTAGVFRKAFPRAPRDAVVLYPSINTEQYDIEPPESIKQSPLATLLRTYTCFVSINRFDPKKDIGKAIRAFALLSKQLPAAEFASLRLIIAGGYDEKVRTCIEYKLQLENLAKALGVASQVVFVPSFTSEERAALLAWGFAVLYTPTDEHFGIVPVEAMYAKQPVIACNNGGPPESILNGVTGILCDDNPEAWCEAMKDMLRDKARAKKMGEAGRQRVKDNFSLPAYAKRFDEVVCDLVGRK